MTTVYEYTLKCVTDNKYETWLLKDTDPSPTTCPTNTGHTIDLDSLEAKVISTPNKVVVDEGYVNKWKGWAFNVHGASGQTETHQEYTWEWPISVLDIQIRTTDENVGDHVQLYVFPPNIGYGESVIGVLSATAPTGATGISVGQTIIDNVMIADHLSLKEGGKEEDLGAIISIDKVNNIVYCKNAIVTEFSHTSPTFVKFKRYILEDFLLGPADRYPLGDSKIGGSYVSAGYIVRVTYINNGTGDKNVYCIIEYQE